MLELMSRAAVLLWACCVFFRSVPAGQTRGRRNTRAPRRPASQAPKGLEYRQVRRFGRRLVAVRLQVILA